MLCTKSHIYVVKVTQKYVFVAKLGWIISIVATSCPMHADLSR